MQTLGDRDRSSFTATAICKRYNKNCYPKPVVSVYLKHKKLQRASDKAEIGKRPQTLHEKVFFGQQHKTQGQSGSPLRCLPTGTKAPVLILEKRSLGIRHPGRTEVAEAAAVAPSWELGVPGLPSPLTACASAQKHARLAKQGRTCLWHLCTAMRTSG